MQHLNNCLNKAGTTAGHQVAGNNVDAQCQLLLSRRGHHRQPTRHVVLAVAACAPQLQVQPRTGWTCRGSLMSCAAAGTEQLTNSNEHPLLDTGAAATGPAWQLHDIIKATTADGSDVFLEVISTPAAAAAAAATEQPAEQQQAALQVAHQGVIYIVEQTQQQLVLQPQGWQLQPDHPLVKALPGWASVLQPQQSKQKLPQQPLQLQAAAVVSSAAQLQAAVQRNPALWCDGTGPCDPPLTGLQYQTLAAGEIECLLNRSRGLVMVQLSVAWDAAAPQSVNNPLVLYSLQRALQDSGISIFMSPAAGGLGLTAILCAKCEPWRSWAAHLVSFGAQAALVAGTPYYKLLVGRMLGYKEENVRYHIQTSDGKMQPTAEVIALVDKEMRKLSKKQPQLPWSADAASGRGAGRTQQQSRTARKRR